MVNLTKAKKRAEKKAKRSNSRQLPLTSCQRKPEGAFGPLPLCLGASSGFQDFRLHAVCCCVITAAETNELHQVLQVAPGGEAPTIGGGSCVGARMLGLSQLESLVAVVREGSCKNAAEALSVTPQAVSKSMASLERIVGKKLTVRRGRVCKPTSLAIDLAVRASSALAAVDEIERCIARQSLTLGGHVGSLTMSTWREGETMAYDQIFQPIRIGSKTARNRIEIAPAAPFLAGHDGSLSPEFYEYNKGLASVGAGIVNLGVTSIDPGRGVGSRVMSIGSDLYLSDFNELAELFHSYGSLASCELVYSRYMLSPADKAVNETTTAEVEEMIQRFADAADRLVRAGFDIAFIHGGHGNVPAMFFSAQVNHRTDRFGGSFEGRCQFAVELLQAIRERVGKRLAITYRLSAEEMLPGTSTVEETLAFAKVIEPFIDLLHVSRGILEVDDLLHYIFPPLYLPRAMNLPFAERFKKELSVPVTVVGAFNLDLAEQAIAAGKVDMVSMIRNVYADQDCLRKARKGLLDDIRPCLRCNTCIDRTHSFLLGVRCAVNPRIGRESRFPKPQLAPAAPRRLKVAIVGGGPAGLQAAHTLADLGHAPVVYEKTEHLGGLLNIAGADPNKREVSDYLAWASRRALSDERVDVHLGVEATPELLAEEAPDAVLLALGSNPVVPAFAKDAPLPCRWVGDVDLGAPVEGERVLIAGAGMTGMECALSLARSGKQVILADPASYDNLGAGAAKISVRCLKLLLGELGVTFLCERFVDGLVPEGAVLSSADGSTETVACDSVIYSLGFRTPVDACSRFEEAFPACIRIGDAAGIPANVFHATQTAHDAAWRLHEQLAFA